MSDREENLWEGQVSEAANTFALKCAELYSSNSYSGPVLRRIINELMTDLWDRGFSQTEIRSAFESALLDMPRYTTGEEKSGGKASLTKFGLYP